MTSPRSIHLLHDSSSAIVASHHYLAVAGASVTPILVGLLSAVVAIGLAITGWRLVARWRRRDNRRTDLTDLGQLLRRIHVDLQLLADQNTVATTSDCQALRTLKYEIDCPGAVFEREVNAAVAAVSSYLDGLFSTALPDAAGAGGTTALAQARTQGRAIQDALTATITAQTLVSRLRDR